MTEYWFVYRTVDGEFHGRGSGPTGGAQLQSQVLGEGLAVLPVSYAAYAAIDPGQALLTVKADACARIDAEAEAVRGMFITAAPGQVLEYQRAREQALAFQQDPEGSYPALQADVTAETIDTRTGDPVTTLAEAADLVLYNFAVFGAIGDTIRAARLSAKASIRAAATIGAIAGVQVDWAAIVTIPAAPQV